MKKIHLVIPMSGEGARFKARGYKPPKPLIPISNIPMIQRVISQFPSTWPCTFIISKAHTKTKLPKLLKSLRPKSKIVAIAPHKKGPSFALSKGMSHIKPSEPVFVSYCDYGMVWDPVQFERFVESSQCDACVVSYRGFHAHYLSPVMYAYSRLEKGRVVEVKEKGCFTENRENEFASSGGYYFKTKSLLSNAIKAQISNELSLNGEYYTSLTVEALLQSNPKADVRVFEIPGFFQWGTPEDLEIFQYWENTFHARNKFGLPQSSVDQILMPMAGLGSRFKSMSSIPKPLIPINGKPLFEKDLESHPQSNRIHLVTLKSIEGDIPEKFKRRPYHIQFLDQTPEGQALSTEAGLTLLENGKDTIVAACDHQIVMDEKKWIMFRNKPNCDAAIFTVTGFPGTLRKPEAYAYVLYSPKKETYPVVQGVSVKKPISDHPSQDPLLVGTFWFRDKSILEKGIQAVKSKNIRVNGELYLDSIFEELIHLGHVVRGFPLDGYINMGDPDSLAESTYWQKYLGGHAWTPCSH